MPERSECTTCDGKVSTEAKWCPHCGQPDPSKSVSVSRDLAGVSLLARTLRKIAATRLLRELRPEMGLHYGIRAAFLEHGIEIPFPQHDLRVRSAVAVSLIPDTPPR
jgi:hypothetical protein